MPQLTETMLGAVPGLEPGLNTGVKTKPTLMRALLRTYSNQYQLYSINAETCKGCGMCARNCPSEAISGALKQAHTIDANACIRCGACQATCRFQSVNLTFVEEVPLESDKTLHRLIGYFE